MARVAVVDAVQLVFVVAAPLAAIALIAVLRLPELRLGTRDDASARPEAATG